MKIAILTDGIYPFVIGGMQKHSFYLCKFLAKLKVDVTLIHCVKHNDPLVIHDQVLEAMELEPMTNFRSTCIKFPKPDWMPGHYLKESYKYSGDVSLELKDRLQDFDFIYAKGFAAWDLIRRKEKGEKFPPIGVKFHGYEMFQKPPSFKSRFEHLLLQGPVKYNNINADYVFSYGGRITPIVKQLGISKSQIVEIPTGIESSWCADQIITHEPGARKFVFLGRYERRKGIEELNEVIKKLLPTEDFVFHFIGPIPQNKQIRSSKIIYHGTVVEKEGIQKIMEGCEILVTPSHSEGMPNVIMEGMARGLSVIATDVGAVCDQVDDEMGWLLPPGNVQALAIAINQAMSLSKEQLDQKRRLALEKVKENFTWEKVSQDTFDHLKQLVDQA